MNTQCEQIVSVQKQSKGQLGHDTYFNSSHFAVYNSVSYNYKNAIIQSY